MLIYSNGPRTAGSASRNAVKRARKALRSIGSLGFGVFPCAAGISFLLTKRFIMEMSDATLMSRVLMSECTEI